VIPSTSKEDPRPKISAHGPKLAEDTQLIVPSEQKEEGAAALLRYTLKNKKMLCIPYLFFIFCV